MKNLLSIHLTDQLLASLFNPSDDDDFEYLEILKTCKRVMSEEEWIELNDLVMERVNDPDNESMF